jgi:hypothetical protein
MQTFRFYREPTGQWYVDLPEYPGPKADLQMVAGADTFLDKLGGNSNIVSLTVSEEPFEGSEHLRLIKECTSDIGGGDYVVENYKGEEINHEMWLCEVMRYVFDKMPEEIYFTP